MFLSLWRTQGGVLRARKLTGTWRALGVRPGGTRQLWPLQWTGLSWEEFWEPLIQYLLEVFKVGMKLLLCLGDLMSWLCSDKQQPPRRGRFHYVSGTWKGHLALRLWLEGLIPSCPSPHSSVDWPSQENAAECQAESAGSVQASEPGLGDSDR